MTSQAENGQLKTDGGEEMRKLARISGGLAASIASFYWALPVLAAGTLCPPGDFSDLCSKTFKAETLVGYAVNVAIFVAFVAALLWLIYGGIRWIISGGDKEATAKAKGTVTSALIGLVIVLAAWIIINLLLTLFGLKGLGQLTLPSINTLPSATTP